jgi:ubiquinone/menaquinone biosynthesis C-methylase UbiE
MTGEEEFDFDAIRANLTKYTERAFATLPELEKPKFIDIGCGSGESVIRLAQLTDGEFTCIDIDQKALDKFRKKVDEAGLGDRIEIINQSMLEMDFPAGSFDVVWSEGSIFAIGFERGLSEWNKLLKPGGFMCIHDEKGNVAAKIKQIENAGYNLLDHFELNIDVWMKEYCKPLERAIENIVDEQRYEDDLKRARREIEMFKKQPDRCESVVFVMQKKQKEF